MNDLGKYTRLRILDPEFSMIASQAAIELDNVILGRPNARSIAIKKLAEFIKHSLEQKTSHVGQAERMNFDSNTIVVLGNAFDTMSEKHAKTVGDLLKEALEVADKLESSEIDKDRPTLEQMREFCVALASCVSFYRQSVEDWMPTHPRRRGQ